MTDSILRQPAGVPVGGEFRAHDRPEAEVELREASENHYSGYAYDLSHSGLLAAQTSISRANARLRRAGIDESFDYEVEEYVDYDERFGMGVTRYRLTLSRPHIEYEGWHFAGAFDRTPNDEILPVYVRDADVPTPTDLICEQCQSLRRRERVYVIRHKDGRTMQVGKSCLELSMGVSPKGLWALDSDLGIREGDEDDEFNAGSGIFNRADAVYPARDLLATAIAASNGGTEFVPRSQATMQTPATADKVLMGWSTLREAVTESHEQLADEVLEWLKAQPSDGDYIAKLKLALGVDSDAAPDDRWVRRKHLPLASSAVSAYRRAQEVEVRKSVEREQKASYKKSYLAPAGTKIDAVPATVIRTLVRESDYGPRTMIELATGDGHQVIWWASGLKDIESGQKVNIRGTVTKNEIWNDQHQTVIARAKLTDPETNERYA